MKFALRSTVKYGLKDRHSLTEPRHVSLARRSVKKYSSGRHTFKGNQKSDSRNQNQNQKSVLQESDIRIRNQIQNQHYNQNQSHWPSTSAWPSAPWKNTPAGGTPSKEIRNQKIIIRNQDQIQKSGSEIRIRIRNQDQNQKIRIRISRSGEAVWTSSSTEPRHVSLARHSVKKYSSGRHTLTGNQKSGSEIRNQDQNQKSESEIRIRNQTSKSESEISNQKMFISHVHLPWNLPCGAQWNMD